jgi:glycosyltransferase involved in cell wall biosynthesis
MTPKISVVMSVYNGETYLREAIDSILNQTFTDFEFIIINDGSTDHAKQILESYSDPRIRLLHQENIGLTKSLNKGLKIATGEYIARMDADDISLSERFSRQVNYLDNNLHVGLIGSRYLQIDEKGVEQFEIQVPIGKENILNHLLLSGSAFCHSSMMFRKLLAQKAGFYDEAMRYAQDYDFGIRMFELCEVANFPEILQKWRYNTSSGISVKKSIEQKQCAETIRAKYLEISMANGLVDLDHLQRLCRMRPSNKLIAASFLTEYERTYPHQDLNDSLTYLQVKYLHSGLKWTYLNKIAEIYATQGKPSLAFMCLVESLRLNPDQPNILEKVEQLEEKAKPKFPKMLKDNVCHLSVIMPTYNRPLQIRDAIRSVLNQTFQDFELIIINDGGTSEVKKTIDAFNSPKIKYFKLETNKGLAGALNEGILRASGKYIAYLDDDDIYYPNHLDNLIGHQRKRDYDFVYSNAWWCYGENKDGGFKEHLRKMYNVRPDSFDKELLFRKNYISTLNILHKKSCFLEVGLFNEDLGQLMDWELWLRFALKKYAFCQINTITGEYRWSNNNMSAVNNLSMAFLNPIIRSYYQFGRGKIGFCNVYLKQGRKKEAKKIYAELLNEYHDLIKKDVLVQEIFFLSSSFKSITDFSFKRTIIRDYFWCDSKKCLKNILGSTSLIGWAVCIIDLAALKVAGKFSKKLFKVIKSNWIVMGKKAAYFF